MKSECQATEERVLERIERSRPPPRKEDDYLNSWSWEWEHPEGRDYPTHDEYNEILMAAEVRSLMGRREFEKANALLGRLRMPPSPSGATPPSPV